MRSALKGGLAWEDLRYLLAVAEGGSLAAAARALGVNHTTVLRRLNAFEARQGLRVFERLPSGYALTAAGEDLLADARDVAERVATLERRFAGRDLRLEGPVRITTTDTLMVSLLGRHLAGLHRAHPGIALEVVVSNALLDLTRRDADVAVRPAKHAPGALVGRRISAVAFAVYGARADRGARPAATDPAAAAWTAPDESLRDTAAARWMRAAVPPGGIALRADSLVSLREVAAAGLGLAVLPCYLGDLDARLARARPQPVPEAETALWVVTHPDLRRTARVRAVLEFLSAALVRERELLEGRRPLASAP